MLVNIFLVQNSNPSSKNVHLGHVWGTLVRFPGVNTQKWLQNVHLSGANTLNAAQFKKL